MSLLLLSLSRSVWYETEILFSARNLKIRHVDKSQIAEHFDAKTSRKILTEKYTSDLLPIDRHQTVDTVRYTQIVNTILVRANLQESTKYYVHNQILII